MAKIAILKGDKSDDQSEARKTFDGLSSIGQDEYTLLRYDSLVFYIDSGDVRIVSDGDNLADFDLVYVRDFQGYEFERNAVAMYLARSGVPFINSDTANFQHISKLTQYVQFSYDGLPIPSTVFAKGDRLVQHAADQFRYPIIVKSITGNSGNDNFLVESDEAFRAVVFQNPDQKFVAQEFIPNDGDLRVIVLGDQVGCVYKRVRKEGDHRNNVSQGGDKIYVDLSDVSNSHKELAVAAAKSVEREICGVDIMVDNRTGAAIVLEANFNFGIRAVPGVVSQELYSLAEYLHDKATTK